MLLKKQNHSIIYQWLNKTLNMKKAQAGGVLTKKTKAPMVDPKGAFTKVQQRTIAGKKTGSKKK